MDDILFLGLPLAVALALAAFVLGLLGLACVLVSLGRPAPLRIPGDGEFLYPAELDARPSRNASGKASCLS
ncbi:hypothetical protein AB4Z32_17750 [Massilia sp. 2TAF26]|uniref:hypothetical protein n=1 Tax=Massilia sp. 2TAF26 TaxID=3233012 RepID=UPI003F9BBED5